MTELWKLSATELMDVTGTVVLESNNNIVNTANPGDYQLVQSSSGNEFISLSIT